MKRIRGQSSPEKRTIPNFSNSDNNGPLSELSSNSFIWLSRVLCDVVMKSLMQDNDASIGENDSRIVAARQRGEWQV